VGDLHEKKMIITSKNSGSESCRRSGDSCPGCKDKLPEFGVVFDENFSPLEKN
jgi:hypothetical protein